MTSSSLSQQVQSLAQEAEVALNAANSLEDLQIFSTQYLGKKSPLQDLFKALKDLTPEEKKEIGPKINQLRDKLQAGHDHKKKSLEKDALDTKLKDDWIDVTKSYPQRKGSLHPISHIQRKVEEVFFSMGFEIADGPEVELEWNNFDALNIPQTHPARDMQDTFFISTDSDDPKQNSVLRTHGTCIDIRKMIEKGVPIRTIAPARVFRNEAIDATHDAIFYQVDGLLVDKHISLAHLKSMIERMLSAIFEKEIKVRIRPGYFPFVEPGLEIDIWWEYTDKNGTPRAKWLEFMGAGMVHPNVFRNCGVDPEEYSGFAFGFGLTRLAMMKYGIEDIRLLFSQKKEFLEQF